MARLETRVLDDLLFRAPGGWAFPKDASSVWGSFLTPWANEVSLIEASAEGLLGELDPRSCTYLLADYERVLGPDPYGRDAASNNLTPQQLATLAYQRWTETGGMNGADYVALAGNLGVSTTIATYQQTMCGVSQCGTALIVTPFEFLVTLPSWATGLVEPLISGEAPAHTWPAYNPV